MKAKEEKKLNLVHIKQVELNLPEKYLIWLCSYNEEKQILITRITRLLPASQKHHVIVNF